MTSKIEGISAETILAREIYKATLRYHPKSEMEGIDHVLEMNVDTGVRDVSYKELAKILLASGEVMLRKDAAREFVAHYCGIRLELVTYDDVEAFCKKHHSSGAVEDAMREALAKFTTTPTEEN